MFKYLQSLPHFVASFISIMSVSSSLEFHKNRHSKRHALLKGTNDFFFIFPIILPIWLKFRTRGLHTTSLNNESLMKISAVKDILKQNFACILCIF